MSPFTLLLNEIANSLQSLKKFWSAPHSPQAAVEAIQTMDCCEEDLCQIVRDGTNVEKEQATELYESLIPLLRNHSYRLQERFAPMEILDYSFANDP